MRDKNGFFKRAKKKEEDLKREIENSEKLGGKDFFAMMLSAFLVFVPISVAILAALSLFVLWLFRAI
ncbi:MAG: hypothetical protein E7634_00125 [Ruminococcaceae bacterium]|nr:hypothetical protein [Oscillospiraceae bacterium]MBQ9692021.1 hypothetical protein [Clostridia bacterium]